MLSRLDAIQHLRVGRACLAAAVLVRRSGSNTAASVLPFCFMGGTSVRELWKHHRWGKPRKRAEAHRFIVALCASMIVWLSAA